MRLLAKKVRRSYLPKALFFSPKAKTYLAVGVSPQSSPAGQALTVVPCFADLGQEEELSPRSESKIHLERTRSNTTSHIPAKGTTSFILTQPNELLYPIDQYYTHTHTHTPFEQETPHLYTTNDAKPPNFAPTSSYTFPPAIATKPNKSCH